MKLVKFLVLGGMLFLATSVHAVDSVSLEAGSNFKNPDTNMWRVGVQWDWGKKWFEDSPVTIGGYWDVSAGSWHTDDADGSHDIGDFSFTPVFRFQKSGATDFIPYAEFAIGFHYLTDTDITQRRRFSTHFQFGDHVGAGLRFGDKGAYDLEYRLQHLSNAGIDHPNPGINFHQIRLEYHF